MKKIKMTKKKAFAATGIITCTAALCAGMTAIAGSYNNNKDMTYSTKLVVSGDGEISGTLDTLPIGIGVRGDADSDNKATIRDAALIAKFLSKSTADRNYMPDFKKSLGGAMADANNDGKLNIRDAALIAKYLASRKTDKTWDNPN